MTNPYYNYTSNIPVTQSRAASSQIRNEYAAIGNGFDATYAAINLLAPLASPTFTGVVTVPTPTTATAAATKAYVDALSVAAGNVPPGGVAGQALIKNSSANYDMSWGQAGTGMGGTTATGNVTLTASSPAAMTITPASPGLYVTLPDATTCTKADNLFAIYNAGEYDYGVKDSTGTQLGWVRARTGAMIGLSDSSTAAGVWAYYGLEKTGVTASYVNSTLTNMGSTIRRIALDANRTCFLFGGTDCYAIVYDASTQTWGSATLVRSSLGSGGAFLGVLSATNQVLVVSNNSTTGMEAVTLTIATNTVTVNTGTKATATLGGTWNAYGQLVAVGSAWVVSYTHTSTGYLRAITVSGTTPTIGAQKTPTVASASPLMLFVSGSVVRTIGAQAGNFYCEPFTLSGTTLTGGTYANATYTSEPFRAFLNGNGNIVCHYINTTHYATIFKLTGTTEAASSVSLGTAPTSVTELADYVAVSASKTAFLYATGATPTWYANVLTDTSGTASAGTEISQSTLGDPIAIAGVFASGNTARFVLGTTSTGGVYNHVSLNCSGASPTISSIQQITRLISSSGGTTNAIPSASDLYGVRQPKLLMAIDRAHLLGGSAVTYDLSLTGTGIQFHKPVSTFNPTSNVSGVVGAANNESFITNSFNNTTTGYIINRVEAAA